MKFHRKSEYNIITLNVNYFSQNGQTALDIAQKLGYISVIETLKVVTETIITTTHTVTIEEKYRVQAPESMQETFMSDSEDEGGEYSYLATKSIIYYPFAAYYLYLLHNLLTKTCDIGTKQIIIKKFNKCVCVRY